MKLHPAFNMQETLPYFYLSKETLGAELWFARTIYNLNDLNVTFTGLENLTGIADAKRLLEDIPNKVRDTLGILVDVNLQTAPQGDFIEIWLKLIPIQLTTKGNTITEAEVPNRN